MLHKLIIRRNLALLNLRLHLAVEFGPNYLILGNKSGILWPLIFALFITEHMADIFGPSNNIRRSLLR